MTICKNHVFYELYFANSKRTPVFTMNFLSLSKSHFLKFYGTFIAVFQFGFLLSTTSQTFGQSGDISVNVDINQSINIELNASSLADANSSFYILSQPSSGS